MNKLDTFLVATAAVFSLGGTGCKTIEDCKEDWKKASEKLETGMAGTNDCDEAGRIGSKAMGEYSKLFEECEGVTEGNGISVWLASEKIRSAVQERCLGEKSE